MLRTQHTYISTQTIYISEQPVRCRYSYEYHHYHIHPFWMPSIPLMRQRVYQRHTMLSIWHLLDRALVNWRLKKQIVNLWMNTVVTGSLKGHVVERVGRDSMPYGYLEMLCLKDIMASIEVYRSKQQKQNLLCACNSWCNSAYSKCMATFSL